MQPRNRSGIGRFGVGLLLAAGVSAFVGGTTLLGALPAGVVPAGPLPAIAPTRPFDDGAARPADASQSAGPVGWAAPPSELRLPSLGVVATVDGAGIGPDGGLVVPDDPRRVGWWVGGAMPGSPTGTVLIAGHVDHATRGLGAMFRLADLDIGAPVEVATTNHHYRYRVVDRRGFPKEELPASLFNRSTPARLALVTCGGAFRPDQGYSHNLVVYAEPVGSEE